MEGQLKGGQGGGNHRPFRCEEEGVCTSILPGAVLHESQPLRRINQTTMCIMAPIQNKGCGVHYGKWLLTPTCAFPSSKLISKNVVLPSNRGMVWLPSPLQFFIEMTTFPLRSSPVGFPEESWNQTKKPSDKQSLILMHLKGNVFVLSQ